MSTKSSDPTNGAMLVFCERTACFHLHFMVKPHVQNAKRPDPSLDTISDTVERAVVRRNDLHTFDAVELQRLIGQVVHAGGHVQRLAAPSLKNEEEQVRDTEGFVTPAVWPHRLKARV